MIAKLTEKNTCTQFIFEVTHDCKEYTVKTITDDKGKLLEESITPFGSDFPLEGEGVEGEISQTISTFLDENWEALASQ